MGNCQGSRAPQHLSDQELSTLRTNLVSYKSKAEDYQSQIHVIQQQIRAVTVLSPDSESTALRLLIQQELRSVRDFLRTIGQDSWGKEMDSAAQTIDELKGFTEELMQEEGIALLKVIKTVAELQETLQRAVSELRSKGIELGASSVPDEVLTQYERLLEAAQQSSPALAERVRQEESSTQALAHQSSELSSSLDFLRSDLSRKELQLSLTRHSHSETHSKAVLLASELTAVKRDLLQCKDKIKELTIANDQLEGDIDACSLVMSEMELRERVAALSVNVQQLEMLIGDKERQLEEAKSLEEKQKEQIAELEQQVQAKEPGEDVNQKMSSVQERLRDIMISLDSEGDEN